MRKFKKLTLTLVALLSMTAGAWAQSIEIVADPNEIKVTPSAGKTNEWTFQMPASNIELQVEYEPTKVTMAANDKTMGTVEVSGEIKVEWTADTWNGWTSNDKEHTVDDITMTSSDGSVYEYTYDYSGGKYKNSLNFFVDQWEDNSTVTFSTTGAPFSRIEFTMIDNYSEYTPNIQPADGWTFSGKSAVWEGEATKSLTLQSCSTYVSKITFFKGGVPDGVIVNGDGTFTVAKTATVTLTATPAEGYKFLYWEDDQTNTNPVREVTIEPGEADKTYTAVFEEITYNVTFVDGIEEADEWSATPNTNVKKETKVDIKYTGAKKVIGVKAAKKGGAIENAYLKWDADQKKLVATEIPTTAIKVENADAGVEWQAGTYVVEGQVTINGSITLNGNVDLIIKDGAKLTAQKIIGKSNNLSIYGQAQMSGQLDVHCSAGIAISELSMLEVHSAEVTATSDDDNSGGFSSIGTFNVYGGEVDAKGTSEEGGYGIYLNGNGPMNIYGGEVKAEGTGYSPDGYGITSYSVVNVKVYGGKLYAECANNKALNRIILIKDASYTSGKIETSADNSAWAEYTDAETPTTKYVRVGY